MFLVSAEHYILQSLVLERPVYGWPLPTLYSNTEAEPAPSPYLKTYTAVDIYVKLRRLTRVRNESFRARFKSLELRINTTLDGLLTTCYPYRAPLALLAVVQSATFLLPLLAAQTRHFLRTNVLTSACQKLLRWKVLSGYQRLQWRWVSTIK